MTAAAADDDDDDDDDDVMTVYSMSGQNECVRLLVENCRTSCVVNVADHRNRQDVTHHNHHNSSSNMRVANWRASYSTVVNQSDVASYTN